MSKMEEISVEIDDKNDIDKINNIDKDNIDTDKFHNGQPITKLEVSPKGNYLVTYSKDNCSIVGWNVWNVEEAVKLNEILELRQMCISDDKKLAYINYEGKIGKK
jgi:WD40 repeat protein